MLTDDRGAAVVEFVLVGVLVLALFLGVLQVALYLHVRNVVAASVAEGAREAANADRDCADGAARTYDLVRGSVGRSVTDGLDLSECGHVAGAGGVVLVRLRGRGPLPLLFPPVGAVAVDATAHAIEEGQ